MSVHVSLSRHLTITHMDYVHSRNDDIGRMDVYIHSLSPFVMNIFYIPLLNHKFAV